MVALDTSGSGRRDGPTADLGVTGLIRIIQRRKILWATVFLATLVLGVGWTMSLAPTYEATATLVPLEHEDVILNWLSSRHAAEIVVQENPENIKAALFPDAWDDASGTWAYEPSTDDAARALHSSVAIQGGTGNRLLRIVVTLGDPVVARDVANAYVRTLDVLRPDLTNLTRQEAFDRYYDGSNQQEAQSRAEVTAQQKKYWLPLDDALVPTSASSPNIPLNVALFILLAIFLSFTAAYLADWLSGLRADGRHLDIPEDLRDQEKPSTESAAGSHSDDRRPRRRYA